MIYIHESLDTIKDLDSIEFISKKISKGETLSRANKRELKRVLNISEEGLSIDAPLYGMIPYLEAFFAAKNTVISPHAIEKNVESLLSGNLDDNELFNGFCQSLQNYASTPEFKRTIRMNRKSELKRQDSCCRYIDAHLENYARLIVVRLDLHLGVDPDKVNFISDLFIDMARYWSRLRRDLRESKKLPNPEGFIAKLEHGHHRGYHYHVMLFFDGSKHQRDVTLAKMIGEHWKQEVTKGQGGYHNCNATDPAGYKYYGIGRVEHWDLDKIENLKFAAYYLAKTDYSLNALNDKGHRTFFRGTMPKKKSRRGRKRI
ncbi:inovirus-type Gp2 protein [Marinobacter salarius]|uniref:YagK/YfjJ domain-containing protein n=1 Tax=Marinobacter salarius TaxID=1420917 RepID=UPI0018F1117B|nr:inovirus-type Gp2 protein [Marinobacter salarius]MBJ7277428.1 inovirus-type Gp2 protein [Marinobacter salarius]